MVNCNKKVLLFASCYSGSFIPYFENETDVFALSATNALNGAHSIDEDYYDGIDYPCDDEPGYFYQDIAYEQDFHINTSVVPNILIGCYHGEFNFHIISAISGKTPAEDNYYEVTTYQNFPLSFADQNNDHIVSIYEAGGWKIENNNYVFKGWNHQFNSRFYANSDDCDDPVMHDPGIGAVTSLLYPTIINAVVDKNETIRGITGIPIEVHVTSGNTLTLSGAKVYLDFDGKLVVDAGATLVIDDNVEIHSKILNGEIVINGDIQIGTGVQFLAEEGCDIQLIINNENLSTTLNDITFTRGLIESNQAQLEVSNCDFSEAGGINFSNGNLIVDNCTFDQASLYAGNAINDGNYVTVTNNCTFINSTTYGIHISNYPNFTIENSTVSDCSNGIGIFNSSGTGTTRMITGNTVQNNGNGILVYNSSADIIENVLISDNINGVQSLDGSLVKIEGNEGAHVVQHTQQIRDNGLYEVAATENSFPHLFRWNAVIDEDNLEPMVYYETENSEELNVSWNHWGENFTAQSDLYPWEDYNYEPIWELDSYGGGGEGDEILYGDAESKIAQGNYTGAKSDLQQIVALYTESIFAQAAMKKMMVLEKDAGNDYTALKNYYLTEPNILAYSNLTKLGNSLANWCEVKQENWPTAIAWFENIIQNPPSQQDYIFAVIDLGYTYELMEQSGLKSNYQGQLTQYIPASKKEFQTDRDELLKQLFKGINNINLDQLKAENKNGSLLQNVPNPFTGTTKIFYKLTESSHVQVSVYNLMGKEIQTLVDKPMEAGIHEAIFDATGMPSGIYYYSISVNGKTTDSRKMSVIK